MIDWNKCFAWSSWRCCCITITSRSPLLKIYHTFDWLMNIRNLPLSNHDHNYNQSLIDHSVVEHQVLIVGLLHVHVCVSMVVTKLSRSFNRQSQSFDILYVLVFDVGLDPILVVSKSIRWIPRKKNNFIYHIGIVQIWIVDWIDTLFFADCIPSWSIRWSL